MTLLSYLMHFLKDVMAWAHTNNQRGIYHHGHININYGFLLEHSHGKASIINDTTVAKQPSKSTNKLTFNQTEVKLG